MIIIRHRIGLVNTNTCMDRYNVAPHEEKIMTLFPDPDESARQIRYTLRELSEKNVAVIINDSFGELLSNGISFSSN